MAGAFLYDDKVAAATVAAVAGSPAAAMPLSYLADPQPRLRTRLMGGAVGLLVDFGETRSIEAAALIATSLDASGIVRWRIGAGEALIEATPLFDLRLNTGSTPAYPAGWAFNRASKGWEFNFAGVLTEHANDVPRIAFDPSSGTCLGLRLEGARTNSIRNPRAEGVSAGSPGTNPTNWGSSGSALTRTIVGAGTENGIPYIDVKYAGTAGSSSNHTLSFEAATQIAASVGQVWTHSFFCRLVGGSTANLTAVQQTVLEVDSGGSTLATNAQAFAPSTAVFGTQRPSYTVTLAQASVAYVRPQLRLTFSNGAVVDITLRIGIPQLELGAPMTTPIMPAVSSPAATTRAADQSRITGLSLGTSVTMLVQCAVALTGGNIVPAGCGPPDDFNNSTYFAIDTSGTATWNPLAGGVGYGPASTAGTVGQANVLVGAIDGAGASFQRNATLRTAGGAWTVPAGFDRIGLGGPPWGNSAAIGLATGTGTYQRLTVYTSRLLDTQLTALAANGSSLVASALTYDSGLVAAETGDDAAGNVILLRPAAVTGRYLQVDITHPAATFIDIGRLVAGPLWRVSRAFAYGIREGRAIMDRRERNPLTGAEFPVPALFNPRMAQFTLPLLTSAEIRGAHRTMLRQLGAAGDALWIPDTGLSQAELNNRSLWGAIATPGEDAAPSRDSFPGNSRAFRIVERV